jgi:hypothetical protein
MTSGKMEKQQSVPKQIFDCGACVKPDHTCMSEDAQVFF